MRNSRSEHAGAYERERVAHEEGFALPDQELQLESLSAYRVLDQDDECPLQNGTETYDAGTLLRRPRPEALCELSDLGVRVLQRRGRVALLAPGQSRRRQLCNTTDRALPTHEGPEIHLIWIDEVDEGEEVGRQRHGKLV